MQPEAAPYPRSDRAPAPEELVGLLADRARRQVFALLDQGPRTLDELIEALAQPRRQILEHVTRMVRVGVALENDGRFSLVDDVFQQSMREAATMRVKGLNGEETIVFRHYFYRNRLVQIPSEPWALDAVLSLIADDFQVGERYREREVNIALFAWHDDWATLRRLLVDHGLMTRSGGVYERVAASES